MQSIIQLWTLTNMTSWPDNTLFISVPRSHTLTQLSHLLSLGDSWVSRKLVSILSCQVKPPCWIYDVCDPVKDIIRLSCRHTHTNIIQGELDDITCWDKKQAWPTWIIWAWNVLYACMDNCLTQFNSMNNICLFLLYPCWPARETEKLFLAEPF